MKNYLKFYFKFPPAIRSEHRKDRRGLPEHDPGIETAISEGVAWLCRAQDNSLSKDGGVAAHFSLLTGWSTSYPETTGYIVPTILEYAKFVESEAIRHRAKRMLDWLVSIQFPEGGFQGGDMADKPIVPVTFNTGQILIGLATGVREFGEDYREPMCRSADWLVKTQDPDGCWRRFPSPFTIPGEKTFDTHAAWGLLEAARIVPEKKYAGAALANVNWALRFQRENGWFDKCCFNDYSQPLTHTLGYVFRGLIEAYRFTKDPNTLHACKKIADGLLTAIHKDGFLPGRLRSDWSGTVRWVCLTGSVQIAYCWLKMYQFTGNVKYRDAGYAANQYVRRTMKENGSLETKGAIKGSFPINGEYGTYKYYNWACKFFIDSNVLERDVRLGKG